jgi:hypothetical protein
VLNCRVFCDAETPDDCRFNLTEICDGWSTARCGKWLVRLRLALLTFLVQAALGPGGQALFLTRWGFNAGKMVLATRLSP